MKQSQLPVYSRWHHLLFAGLLLLLAGSCAQPGKQSASTHPRPNILIIYADDLGYGDVSCYGATAVATPHVDSLAHHGLRFTDGHCSASTCTPSRYAILTGSYAFRDHAAILPGDAPLIIDTNMVTIAGMLRKAGYATAAIGKWHLGLGSGHPDWNSSIEPGPLEVGFDYSFLIPATPDRVPTVFVRNHHVVNLNPADTLEVSYTHRIGSDAIGLDHPGLLKMAADSQHSGTIVNGISRIGFMKGGHQAYWNDEEFAQVFNAQATAFIAKNRHHPFFLYYALPFIHVPRAPNPRFVGKTTMGPRGDDIVAMDWMTGKVMETLKKYGLDTNTLVIFSSDNGPILNDGYEDSAVEKLGNHHPAGIYKGGKYSVYEGGTRVPFITYWPGHIPVGTDSALISQVDLYASLADLVGVPIQQPRNAPDSKDLLDVLMGRSQHGRTDMVEEAFTLGLRDGNWKYIAPVSHKTPDWLKNKVVPTGLEPQPQLYDLGNDPSETHNLAGQDPQRVAAMSHHLQAIMQHPE